MAKVQQYLSLRTKVMRVKLTAAWLKNFMYLAINADIRQTV